MRVESEEAELYKIVRDQFWTDVNQNRALQDYVKEYYRKNLMYSMKKNAANADEWQIWCGLYTIE